MNGVILSKADVKRCSFMVDLEFYGSEHVKGTLGRSEYEIYVQLAGSYNTWIRLKGKSDM